MANLTSDVTEKMNGPSSEFKNKIKSGELQLEKMAQSAGEKVGAMASALASTTSETIQTGRDYVKENPVKGIAAAAAVGAIAGSLLTFALRSRKP